MNGLLVPSHDASSLSRAMFTLLQQPPSISHHMSEQSYILARDRFDVHKVNSQLLEVMSR